MAESKNTEKENPLMFYAVIIIALGLVGYKWYAKTDFHALFQTLIPTIVISAFILILLGRTFTHLAYETTNENKYYIISKILQHTIFIIIIASLIYRSIPLANINFSVLYILHLIISIIIILYYNHSFYEIKYREKETQKLAEEQFKKESKETIEFLKFNPKTSKEIKDILESIRYKQYSNNVWKEYKDRIHEKREELEKEYTKLRYIENITELEHKEKTLKESIQKKEEENKKTYANEESRIAEITYDLLHANKNIYTKKELNKEKIAILKANKYKQVNEYCIYEQKIITVFIKPIMNHSVTHMFLVWSMKRLLQEYDTHNLQEHETRDADITFTYKNKKYAIEIETGNLLKKTRATKCKN